MHTNHSIGTSLTTHGIQGVGTHHKVHQLMADAEKQRLISDLHGAGTRSGLRHRLGGMMISLGAVIAGKTHDIQERQATMPSPTAKSGFVPTR